MLSLVRQKIKNNINKNNICMLAHRPIPRIANRLKIAMSVYNNYGTVDFICPSEHGQKKYELINNINVFRTEDDLGSWEGYLNLFVKYILFCFRSFSKILRLNRDAKYSIFHIHSPPDFLMLVAIPFKIIYGSKIILDIHDMLPEAVESNLKFKGAKYVTHLAHVIEKSAIFFSDAVICTNLYDKQIILSRNNISSNKIFTILNTPNLKEFEPQSSNKEEYDLKDNFVLLFEGTIWNRRGIQTIVYAIDILKDKIPIYLLIVGDGPDIDDLKKIVSDKNLGEFIKFTGWVGLISLYKYISISDVCLIPFLKTKVNDRGVPNKLFEYVIHDKPVIASRLKGMAMTFSDDEISFFEAGNANDLADKILWCYNNPTDANRKVHNAKLKYLREYTWDKMETELYRCYDSVLV